MTHEQQLSGWKSPALIRWEEAQGRQAADDAFDPFQMPETRTDLERMTYADRCRVYRDDRERYARLTAET
ncbi:hypothetical protein [Streptomyces sp. NPDC054797]